MSKTEDRQVRCSFCGKRESQIKKMIEGPGVFICDECVDLCCEILEEYGVESGAREGDDFDLDLIAEGEVGRPGLLRPQEIRERLDEYVIGQDRAKRALSVAVYNHYRRIEDLNSRNLGKTFHKKGDNQKESDQMIDKYSHIELTKSNILMLGPTGVGKTYLAQTLARILNVPFAIADATSLTEAGYVGEDVENILLRLIQAADYDIERAEKGIIFIDEIDKIARRSDNPSITRDVSGEGVQQALLKILEGTIAAVPPQGGRKHPHQEFIHFDTTNVLFICSGAFDGMPKIVESRLGKNVIGFSGTVRGQNDLSVTELLEKVEPQDLLKFGLIPEFIGRVPMIVTLEALTKDMLKEILVSPKNALVKQYGKMLAFDGVELEFDEDALNAITEIAIARQTGARGLRAIIESAMLDVMYEIPSMEDVEKCIITRDTIEKGKFPTLVKGKKQKRLASAETAEA